MNALFRPLPRACSGLSALLLAVVLLCAPQLFAGWSVTGGSLTLHGGASFKYDDGNYPPTNYSYTGHPPTYIAYVFTDPSGNEHSWSGPIGGSPWSSVGASATDDFDQPGTWTVTFWWLNNPSLNTWYKADAVSSYQFTIGSPTPPPTVNIAASPSSLLWTGGQVQISWSSTDADTVSSSAGFSATSVNGNVAVVVPSNQSYADDQTYIYSITVTGPGGTTSASTPVTVAHRVLQHVDFTFGPPVNFTYNGATRSPTITTFPRGVAYQINSGTASATDAGTYSFTVEAAQDGYEGSATCTWSIDPKPITFSFGNLSHTYDGSSKSASVTPSDSSATYNSNLNGGTTAGSYGVSAIATGNYTGSGSDTLTIAKQPISVSWGTTSFTYDGSTKSLSHDTSNNGAVSGSGTDNATDAGSYTYSYSLNDPTNYEFANGNSQSWSIDPKSVSFSFSDLSQQYDGAMKTASVSASDPSATYSSDLTKGPGSGSYTVSASAYGNYSGSGSDTLVIEARQPTTFSFSPRTFVYDGAAHSPSTTTNPSGATYDTSGTTSAITVGNYSFSVNATGSYSGSDTCNWSITAKPVTFVIGNLNPTYNGSPQAVSVSGSDGSATYAVTYSAAGYGPTNTPPTNAGSYTVVVTANGNYSGSQSGTLTINKRAPTITWPTPAGITYGTALTSTQLNATASVPGSFSYSPAIGSVLNAGSQSLNATFTPTDSANYTTASGGVALSVSKASLTVTAANVSRTYGAANPAFTVTYSGFVNGDTSTVVSGSPSFATAATLSSSVGAYGITPAIGTLSAANYSFGSFVNGTLTVNKASLTATADSQTRTYGSANPTLTISYSGFVNGDTTTAITAPNISTTATAASGVGSYAITLSGGSATNYSLTLFNGTLTVTKATLTVTANNQSRTYGAPNPTFTYTLSGFVNGETSTVISGAAAATTTAAASSGAGTYAITPTVGTLSASNYSFGPFVNGTLTVNKASLTATADNQTKIYGTANPTLTISYSGFVNGDTATAITAPSISTTASASSGAGLYAITLSGGAAANYTLTLVNGTLTVSKATLTVTSNNQSRGYGAANPTLTYLMTGFVNGDTSAAISGAPSVTTTATTSSSVGTYAITTAAGTLAAANYQFAFGNGTLTITKASLTVTANDQTKIYGSANPVLTYTLSGFVNGDTSGVVSGTAAVSSTATNASGVGIYQITPSAGTLAAANYTFGPFVNGTLTIAKAPLSVTANNKSKVYGSANPTFDATITGFVNGDLSTVVSGAATFNTAATSASAVGAYTITPALGTLTASNYSFTAFANGTLTVTKAALTATADNQSKTYGAANPTLTVSYSGFVNGDTSSSITAPAISTTATISSAVGSYPITVTGGAAANYTLTLVNGTLTVNKASLTVTANKQSKVYGAANPSLTMSYTGFVNGDSASSITVPSISTTATVSSAAGAYPISLTGGSAANYSLSLVNGTLTITKAPLTATADNQTRIYGTGNPTLTITYSGLVNGDTAASINAPTIGTTATTSTTVGTYPITLSGGTAANYTLTLVNGTLTINRAALTVTANNQSKIYGAANPGLTYTLSGFVNGETSAVVSGAAAVTTTATTASAVGAYAITPAVGTLAAANYSFASFVNGTLTVSKAPLTATANNQTKTYGSANPALTMAFTGFVNGDTSSSITTPGIATAVTTSSGVGNYAITLSGGSAANYTLTLVNGTLTVTPASLNVVADAKSRLYGAQNPALTYTYSGFMNGDTASSIAGAPSLTTSADTASNVGAYPIVLSSGTLAAANYQFVLTNGTLTVTPKPITFSFSNLSHTYSGASKSAAAAASDGAATFTSDLTKGPDAGSYTVSATATGNYTGSGSATLTISAKAVTFTFGNLMQTYDGTMKSASVTSSDPLATFTSDLTKGPNANTYVVSATATGNFSGTGTDNLVISPAAQVVTLTPGTATAFVGQSTMFTAAGGQNGYVWGGNAGASGSSANVNLSFATVGTYTLTVTNASSGNYLQSNTAGATIQVVSNHQVNSLTPIESSYTINDANSAMNGQTYGRIWQASGWTAYLGRSGVRFAVTAQAWPSVKTIELQAKAPGGDWTQLAVQSPTDTATTADVTFSVMLGNASPDQPLVPLSYQQGSPQTGQWLFRARVQDAADVWGDYSSEVPVNVILPVISKTISGQTVPPAGELGNWFTASSVQNYTLQFWIP